MNANDTNLYRTARNYVSAAIQLLAANWPEGEARSSGIQDWSRTSEGVWVLRDISTVPWHPWHLGMGGLEKLHALPEHIAFAEALKSDPVIAPQLDTLVGTMGGARRVSLDEATDRLIWMMVERCGSLEFRPAVFGELFEQFWANFTRDAFDFVFIAPLPLFKMDSFPIELGSDVTIDRLTDAEIKRCLQVNLFHFMPFGAIAHVDAEFAIRVGCHLEKRVGEIGPSGTSNQWFDLWRRAQDQISDVLYVLHLFKHGRLSHAGIVLFSEQWPVNGGTSGVASRQAFAPGADRFQLNTSEVAGFRTFWSHLERARGVKFIDAAIRRFGYAGERSRPQDRLVDLMIAAESLFLSDTAEAGERGELRFRLALRFAYYVDNLQFSRPERFRHMRNAYDARSALVHGGAPDLRLLTLPGEGRVDLEKFVEIG